MSEDAAQTVPTTPDEAAGSDEIRRFGRYVLLKPLGAGGMGVVSEAYDPELGRKVALKLVHFRERRHDAPYARAQRSHLMREARAMAQLGHSNVVAIHDIGEHENRVYLAMELIEGKTLQARIRSDDLEWREMLSVMLNVGRGLAAAHVSGLTHGDVKPVNILLGEDGRVCIADFGLAQPNQQLEASLATLEPSRRSKGTLGGNTGSSTAHRIARPFLYVWHPNNTWKSPAMPSRTNTGFASASVKRCMQLWPL